MSGRRIPERPAVKATLDSRITNTDGRRVYAIFANGDLVAVDFDGQQVWLKNLGQPKNPYGHASSLAMYQSLLLVLFDQGTKKDGG